jgi:tetrahydromethanopterin S-methyltransferase subunit F
MDKTDILAENRSSFSTYVVDGIAYGFVSGTLMFVSLAALTLFSGEAIGATLERISVGSLSSPLLSLAGHLGVSAIYGALFGALIWPLKSYLVSREILGWIAGVLYAAVLLLVAQFIILPTIFSPAGVIPPRQWVLAHGVYGLILGGLFARKIS